MRRCIAGGLSVGVVAAATGLAPMRAAAAADLGSIRVSGITLSPAFTTDSTVFAVGTETDTSQCGITAQIPELGGSCTVLLRSTSGGHTWTIVNNNFPGGQVGLPPQFPVDPAIYAFDGSLDYRSDDGGVTFKEIFSGPLARVEGSGPGAMLPGGSAGHARVAFAGSDGVYVYDEATRSTHREVAYPAQVTLNGGGAAIVAVGADTVVVNGSVGIPVATAHTVLLTCTFGRDCAVTGHADGESGLAAPSQPDGFAASFSFNISTTHDAAKTWTQVQSSPGADSFSTFSISPHNATDHTVLVSRDDPRSAPRSFLWLSTDDATTLSLTPLAAAGLPAFYMIGATAIRPDGSLIIGLGSAFDRTSAPVPTGIFCSSDSGATFTAC